MTKLLCTGDTQLGVQTVDLDDQEQVLHRIADVALAEQVDAVLHGGDVFEGPQITPEQLRAFRRPLARLRNAGIPVVVALGNGRHDQAMRDATGLDVFEDIPGVSVYRQPGVEEVAGVSVAVLPWTHPGRLVAAEGGGDRDEINTRAAELLVEVARGLRAGIDGPAVLLLHWSISGASLPSGLPVEMAREPILDVYALEELGFDAIVAAHVHKPQVLDEVATVFYVGSPQPLNHGEPGEHGVWILTCGGSSKALSGVAAEEHPAYLSGDAGSIPALRFVPVESRPFVTLDVDVTGEPDGSHAHNAIVDAIEAADLGRAAVRLRYRATAAQARGIESFVLQRVLREEGAHRVSIQPEIIREQRARVAGMDESIDDTEALALWLNANGYSIDDHDPRRDLIFARHQRYTEQVAG